MHDELARRGDALVGILNGIDTSVWDPTNDPFIAEPFDASNAEAGTRAARDQLLHDAGWDDDGSLVLGVVSRLVDQKGIVTVD